MMFVYPSFLWALLAISIPIIIHLFNFRRYKKVYFTNVQFLKELQLESQSKSRLKELLILLSRILAITCLVLAFAQPIITNSNNTNLKVGQKTIGIYIDNSFSMEAVNKQGPLLENAKKLAKDVINSYRSIDRFHLITNDFEGKHQRLYTKDDILNEINDIKSTPSVKLFAEVLKRQKDFLSKEDPENTFLYAITDAQRSSFNLSDIKNDSTSRLTIIPIEANETNNVFIDSCWFDSPVQQKGFVQKLNISIKNSAQKNIDAGTVRLIVNGDQTSIGSFSLESNSSKSLSISFTVKNEGFNYASVKLDDYPITFDDELFFAFNSKLVINALLINGIESTSQNYFNSLFSNDSLFHFISCSEKAIDYSKFKTSDLIILNEVQNLSNGLLDEIIKFCNKGGNLVIIPSVKSDLKLYNSFYQSLNLPLINNLDTHALKVNKPDKNDPFFEGVFEKMDPQINLPLALAHFSHLKSTRSSNQDIYTLQNNEFFLTKNKFQNASVFLFSSPFDDKYGNFCKHALFVPTFIRIAVTSLRTQPLFYFIKQNNNITIRQSALTGEQPPHVIGRSNKIDLIPEMRSVNGSMNLYLDQQLNRSGFYDITWQNSTIQNLAFNYDRIESNLIFYNLEDLKELIIKNGLTKYNLIEDKNTQDVMRAIQLNASGIKLWKWFILFTLFFIAIEIALIRFIK
ncbi:MAG: BatA domain-containing protein [Sphingobacteriaceae bacterium]